MEEKDIQHIKVIIEAISKILKIAEPLADAVAFKNDSISYEAIVANLVVIDETDSKISSEIKFLNQDVQWKKIKMYKNLVYNSFYDVDAEGVWMLVTEKLPKLKAQLLEAFNENVEK